MSITYSGLTNYGKSTLPSVEGWGTSMNILKDPPKGIHTRRKNKVGQTSFLATDIDAAGDRAAEAIRVYARGTNPMVSVMYDNTGTCGGQTTHLYSADPVRDSIQTGFDSQGAPVMQNVGGAMRRTGSTMASLPYKIMQGGAFRPPVLTQQQLLPLSRQARPTTRAFSMPGFADFTKKLRNGCSAAETKAVRKAVITIDAYTNKRRKRTTGATAPQDLKHAVVEKLLLEGQSGSTNKSQTSTYKAAKGKKNLKPFINQNCRKPVEVGYTKTSNIYKRRITNNEKSRLRNIPLSTWAGTAMAKVDIPRTTTYRLPERTVRGGFDGKSTLPVVAAEAVGSIKCGKPNIAFAARKLPLEAGVNIRASGACGGPVLTTLR
jgi:hypothetical protein